MSDLNLENIEKLLDTRLNNLSTKKDLEPLASKTDVNSISKTLAAVAANTANLVVDMSEVKTELKQVHDAVDSHTGTLDKILVTTSKLDSERLVETERLKRLENWALQVGEKLGIKLEV